ncbi:unnamed protein product [Timema podura]|uniref:Anoctamin n=1 Tax=Timema podura TaxID=61482 RepID=A0ABN7NCA0_TIMPD|nr:unnamed protein product [Timema podura]
MFPPGAQDFTLMWLLSRLRAGTPGLVVHVRHHASSDSYGYYLTAPFNVLMKAAEEVHLPKSLRPEFGGGLKEFVQQEMSCFEGIENEREFFTTQERQSIVLHLLQTLRAGAKDQLGGVKFVEGQAIDAICNYFGVKVAMYFAWLGHYTTALIIPGVIGLIFWIGFCGGDQATEDVGFVLFSFFNVLWASIYVEAWKRYSAELAYRWGTLDQRDELLVEPRSFFTPNDAQFLPQGTLEVSPVTGRLEPTYPAWKRNVFRYFVSVPIIFLCLLTVFVIMIYTLQLQEWWDTLLTERGYSFYLSYLPKILLAVVIALMDEAYYKVACWLNDRGFTTTIDIQVRPEGKKFENTCSKQPIISIIDPKTNFHLLVLVGWIRCHLCLIRLLRERLSGYDTRCADFILCEQQLAALLIARQVIGNLKESALPYLLEQLRLAKLSFDLFGALSPTEAKKELPGNQQEDSGPGEEQNSIGAKPAGNRNVSQAELESTLFKYDGTFEDHLEIFIQLGYVVLFSSAFPMAAFCAFLNNLIEIRSDAFKLCFIFQRPFGQRVSSIGTWQNAMEVMGLIAVLVNCALIGLSGQVHRMFPEMSTTQTILLIVALEHIMLTLRFIISCAIPDLPEWVATEMAKVEFSRREAHRRLSSTTTSPPPEQTPQAGGMVIGRFVVSPASEERRLSEEGHQSEPEVTMSVDNSPNTERTPLAPERVTPLTPTPPHEEHVTISSKDINPIPPFCGTNLVKAANKKSPREWLGPEGEALGYHLTIGPHGVDWVRRFGMDSTRKASEPEVGAVSGEDLPTRRSTDCIVTPKDLASSSDSDLLRSAPPWATTHTKAKFRFSPEKAEKEGSLSDSSQTMSSLEGDEAAAKSKSDELAAKKTRVKQSLMKRARSVAIFSLKLKERRARDAQAKEVENKAKEKWMQPQNVGGELSCIPIEKLISVDDVAMDLQRRKTNPSSNL